MIIVRQENESDYNVVYNIVKTAFLTAEHSDGNEQDLVVALRKGAAFITELSLVAEMDGEIVGHILFTKAKVGEQTVLVLAPLSVVPKCQKQGIGGALIKEGHRIAKELGYTHSLVLGSEHYYPRFGYVPAKQFGIEVPDGIPEVNFMAILLQGDKEFIYGSVMYAKEFGNL